MESNQLQMDEHYLKYYHWEMLDVSSYIVQK